MKQPRYRLMERGTGRYLMEAQQIGDSQENYAISLTADPAKAMRFPGAKSARRMAARLDIDYDIINQRGEIIK